MEVDYSMAIQLVHERSGAVLCVDARALAVNQKFAMKMMLKNIDTSPGMGEGGTTAVVFVWGGLGGLT